MFVVKSRLSFSLFAIQDEETAVNQLKAIDEAPKGASLENMMVNIPLPSKETSKQEKEPVKVVVPRLDFMLGIAGRNSGLGYVINYYVIGNISPLSYLILFDTICIFSCKIKIKYYLHQIKLRHF